MASIKEVKLNGEKVKDIKLNDDIFNISNDVILKKAIRLQMNSMRQGTHSTKDKSEVSGGGRKPYRQKGTAHARQGSIRAPQYRGGGVVFGPKPRNYSFKTNRKERRIALRAALSDKVFDKKLIVVDSLDIDSTKTKNIKNLLDSLKVSGKVLFVTANDAEKLYLATRNISNLAVSMVSDTSVRDIVYADYLVLDEDALKYFEEALG